MSKLYEQIEQLCAKRGINITKLCKETGISRSALTELKKGRTQNLSSQNIYAIAQYFEIPPEYFMAWEDGKINKYTLFPMNLCEVDDLIDKNSPEETKSPPVPEGTEDEWLEMLLKLNEDELLELRNYVRYLRYKRDHAADLG